MKIAHARIVAFTQQLATMVEAGIPLIKCLEALEKQENEPKLKRIIHHIKTNLNSGTPLSYAFSQHKKTLSPFLVSMVYAGEQGIGLVQALRRVGDYLEKEEALRAKVKQVFTYPLVVGIFCFLIVSFLIVVIAPIFAKVYEQLNVTLPLPTRFLMGISKGVRKFGWLMPILSLVLGFIIKRLKKDISQRSLDFLIRHAPLLGYLSKKVAIAKFIRTFSTLLVCHVPLTDALEVVKKVVDHRDITQLIQAIKLSVESGGTITEAMVKSNLFSSVVIQMAQVGEQSSKLGPLLEKCADSLDLEVDALAKKLLMIIEPTMTLGIALIVGFIAMAIYMPMFDLMGHVGK